MVRIAYPDPLDSSDIAAALADIETSKGWIPSPHRFLAHSPHALVAFEAMSVFIASGTSLSARLRELVVLRISQCLHNEFEWAYHSRSAPQRGVANWEIAALAASKIPAGLSEPEEAAVMFASQCLGGRVTDELVVRLQKALSSGAIVELTLLIGYYRMAHILALVGDYADEAPAPSVPLPTLGTGQDGVAC